MIEIKKRGTKHWSSINLAINSLIWHLKQDAMLKISGGVRSKAWIDISGGTRNSIDRIININIRNGIFDNKWETIQENLKKWKS